MKLPELDKCGKSFPERTVAGCRFPVARALLQMVDCIFYTPVTGNW